MEGRVMRISGVDLTRSSWGLPTTPTRRFFPTTMRKNINDRITLSYFKKKVSEGFVTCCIFLTILKCYYIQK